MEVWFAGDIVTQSASDFEAVHDRQAQVEQHEVRSALAHALKGYATEGRGGFGARPASANAAWMTPAASPTATPICQAAV